jgi:hypothetical protein
MGLTAAAAVALAGALLVLLRLPSRADANHDAGFGATAPDHPAAAERPVTTPNMKGHESGPRLKIVVSPVRARVSPRPVCQDSGPGADWGGRPETIGRADPRPV